MSEKKDIFERLGEKYNTNYFLWIKQALEDRRKAWEELADLLAAIGAFMYENEFHEEVEVISGEKYKVSLTKDESHMILSLVEGESILMKIVTEIGYEKAPIVRAIGNPPDNITMYKIAHAIEEIIEKRVKIE